MPSDNSWTFEAYLTDAVGLTNSWINASVAGFGASDAAVTTGWNYEATSDWYNSAPGYPQPMHHKDMWMRVLVDQYGVYMRLWEDGTAEPVDTGGVVPSLGGRGEHWHAFDVYDGGLPAMAWRYIELRLSGGTDVTSIDSITLAAP